MIERRYENDKKVYVKVAATFSPDGKLQPVAFWWEDQRRYENDKKVYVKVAATFSPDGKLQPVAFWWEDQRRYNIDKVTDVCRAASLRAGGVGIRYTCVVYGKETNLYFEEDRWFMERRVSV